MTIREFETRYIVRGTTERGDSVFLKEGNETWVWSLLNDPFMFKTSQGAVRALEYCGSFLKPVDGSIEIWKVEHYKPKIVLSEKVITK